MVKDYSVALLSVSKPKKSKIILGRMFKNRQIYIMLIPVMLFFILFSYVPMYGIIYAWQDYGEWVGWLWFQEFFENPLMSRAITNTLIISGLKLLFCFPASIILALLINEIKHEKFKKVIQWAIYLPYFINWVVIGGIVGMLLRSDGVFNNILIGMGIVQDPILFLQDEQYYYTILIVSEIWKGIGWGTVIYTAGMAGIDQSLYEAAKIDGCNRFKLVYHVTLPCILPLITVMLIMQIGNLMNAGFDSVYNLPNYATCISKAEIIDTLIYEQRSEYNFVTAVGLFKNVINFALLITANIWTKKINGYSMYSLDN